MMGRCLALLGAVVVSLAPPAAAAPTRSSPIAVAPDGVVFVVNPDSHTVARLEFDAMHVGTLTHEAPVGQYPRTVATAGAWVFTADQSGDTVTRRDQADLGAVVQRDLGFGCAPYGVAPTPAGDTILVTCQGTSEVVLLDTGLTVLARIELAWPNARALAVTADGRTAYVTHYLTEEPGTQAHVSVIDVANKAVAQVFAVDPDTTTCETQNSGQGVLNLISAIAIVPAGELAGQVWIGGTQQNNISKGLFKREASLGRQAGAALFPAVQFTPFPPRSGANRNIYKASFHDITRFGIFKLDGTTGARVGKIDVDEANNATDIEFSADGRVAYVVDLMFNSYHVFNTRRGQDGDATTLFASVSAFGPGGADPNAECQSDALAAVRSEAPFRLAPQAQISVIEGYDPVDAQWNVVNTGLEFDAVTYMATGTSRMKAVPDGVGTAPIGVRLAPDGRTAYVANYLSRNVVPVATADTVVGGGRTGLRCVKQGMPGDAGPDCARNDDCSTTVPGFCNHPGGAACNADADCGAQGPCIKGIECVPIILGPPTFSITGDPTVDPSVDPLPPAILDGKILFNTAARDASYTNGPGLATAAPRFNDAALTGRVPGSVVSTAHDASYVTCTSCHADFGGQDGRTWDFSQFGASLRNTMDLRGRAGYAPGTCSHDPSRACFFDAACGDGNVCRANPRFIPPNVQQADPACRVVNGVVSDPAGCRWFNPMLTVHWNGDRDEVEDFEHTYRQLMGCGDCDAAEDVSTCQGCLIQRSPLTSTDPVDVNPDLGSSNRNIRGIVDPSKNVGVRLSNMADFVYSLTAFPKNPNAANPEPAVERGRLVFNDRQVKCASCHNGGPGPGQQFFTDKQPNPSFDFSQPARADGNNPFIRHDVGTGNFFDHVNPREIAAANATFQNPRVPIPGDRGPLDDYVTPVLNDVWNTAPYLHDGSAHTLLDVVRPCDTRLDDCFQAGRGRNVDDQHGVTSILTPQQLNDLVAFQKALTSATLVADSGATIRAGTLTVKRAIVRFPTQRRRATARRTRSSFELAGTFGGVDIDLANGLRLTIATPSGERMVMLTHDFAGRSARRLVGRAAAGEGVITVAVRRRRGGFRFVVRGRKLDLSAFDPRGAGLDPDLTIAVEAGGAQFVKNRSLTPLKGRKDVYRLPRRRR